MLKPRIMLIELINLLITPLMGFSNVHILGKYLQKELYVT